MKVYIKNVDYKKYYRQILPYLKKEKNQQYLFIILTLSASIFFALFAINPTLSTIVRLRREISDSQFVNEKLTQKVNNLSTLTSAYQDIEEEIPFLLDAVPANSDAPILVGQIQTLAEEHAVVFTNISISPINLKVDSATKSSVLNFELVGNATYENIYSFLRDLINMQRIVVVDGFSLSKNDESGNLDINIKGSAYYKY
ncbi:MAG: hypothetical protein A3A51_04270 [Candidatus Levybacteria bacterium RIFCSPLOWO2_01_FULL_39_10]|nr:MAG: hypothetical protein A3A51_04270 [Candidatus Levybacteria bacterium RIFCSPLOWO2_01_FULL_39_10]